MNDRETINIVWLKRDLRLHDNEAIANAINAKKRFLIDISLSVVKLLAYGRDYKIM